MKPKYSAVFNQPNIGQKQFSGLSETQLVHTLLKEGVHTLSSITHEETPGEIRPVEGVEMISIWKQVYRSIQVRKH
jgi:hypothetical protein